MAFQMENQRDEATIDWIEQVKKKGIHESDDAQQFEAIFKRPSAWAFHSQLAFSVTETQFDLPAPFRGKNNFPRLIFFFHLLIGYQLPHLFLHANFH